LVTRASAWSGTEVHTLELASLMARRGHTVTIVQTGRDLYSTPVRERRIGVGVTSLPLRYGGLKSIRADVGVLVKGSFDIGSPLADAAHRFAFPRFVTIEHLTQSRLAARPRIDTAGLRPRLGVWWYRDALSRRARSPWPHLTICVADAVKTRLLNDSGFPASRVTTVHNGVDTARFRRDEAQGAALKARWGIPAGARVFGAIGRLSPMKNLELAVRGLAGLDAGAARDAWLVLAGDGPERKALESVARRHGVETRVLFPGPTSDPASVYSAFDLFVMPSVNEGLPFALLEAMSSECAPIATDVGGIPEVITEGTGWIVPAGDGDAFGDAMREAATMPPLAVRQIGAAARRRVHTRFNADVQYAALADLLESNAVQGAGRSVQ
jgi:glycosyltransferase involved in cell wall biosynthesis